MMEGDNRPQDLLELMLEILKNTPIEYQITFIDETLDGFIEKELKKWK